MFHMFCYCNKYTCWMYLTSLLHQSGQGQNNRARRVPSWNKQVYTGIDTSFALDVMVTLTWSSLPWVLHIWMSGTNPLQIPRAWFWGTHKWAISAALLGGRVSRIADRCSDVWSSSPQEHWAEVFTPILLRWLFSLQCPALRRKMVVCWCCGSWWSASWF